MTRNEFLSWATRVVILCDIEEAIDLIADKLEQEVQEARDQVATDIAQKLQDCTPKANRTVADAQVQGAWTNAAKIATTYIGRKPIQP